MITEEHTQRIKQELTNAGVTGFGLRKFNSKYLPKVIHEEEHIMGVIYGRYQEDGGFLGWVDRMLVATDRRVVSLNHKPGFTDVDEFMYDMVAGIESSTAGPFTAIVLKTRTRKITVRFVNAKCAEKFVQYIELRQVERPYKQP